MDSGNVSEDFEINFNPQNRMERFDDSEFDEFDESGPQVDENNNDEGYENFVRNLNPRNRMNRMEGWLESSALDELEPQIAENNNDELPHLNPQNMDFWDLDLGIENSERPIDIGNDDEFEIHMNEFLDDMNRENEEPPRQGRLRGL